MDDPGVLHLEPSDFIFVHNRLLHSQFVDVSSLSDSMVVYECCPGYMKLEGMRGCPAGEGLNPETPCGPRPLLST